MVDLKSRVCAIRVNRNSLPLQFIHVLLQTTFMAAMNDTGKEGIVGRSLRFCPSLQEFNTDDLILTCPECECFLLYCCSCSSTYEAVPSKPCHHFQIMFTDGACINNGQRGATAGIGIAFGLTDDAKHSIPVDADVDDFPKRTSQRAELLAAIEGLRWLSAVDGANTPLATKAQTKHGPRDPEKAWIIATDSAYVVNGMTEWLPAWKVSIVTWWENYRFTLTTGCGRTTTCVHREIQRQQTWTSFCG